MILAQALAALRKAQAASAVRLARRPPTKALTDTRKD